MASALQNLYNNAVAILTRISPATKQRIPRVPTHSELLNLRRDMERCDLASLGHTRESLLEALHRQNPLYVAHRSPPPIDKIPHYIRVVHNDFFSIGAFVLPEEAKLQLHNHPGMLIIGKTLLGTIETSCFNTSKIYRGCFRPGEFVVQDYLDMSQMNAYKEKHMPTAINSMDLYEHIKDEEISELDIEMKNTPEIDDNMVLECQYLGSYVQSCEKSDAIDRNALYFAQAEKCITSPYDKYRLKLLLGNDDFNFNASFMVFPSFANVHHVEGKDLSVMLDLQVPPYRTPESRNCTFFDFFVGKMRINEAEDDSNAISMAPPILIEPIRSPIFPEAGTYYYLQPVSYEPPNDELTRSLHPCNIHETI